MRRLSAEAVVLVLVLVAAAMVGYGGVAAGAAQPAPLAKEDRALLAEALANGKSTVTLLVASAPGANPDVARSVRAKGAVVEYRDDDVGYLRLRVPPQRAAAVAATPGIAAVAVDRRVDPIEPDWEPPPATETAQPPGADTPAVNPYLPAGDLGAPQFVQANPTYDGRGVTVGIIEFDGVDLFTPELQTARLLDGSVVPKVADYITTTNPATDPTWVAMTTQVTSADNTVTFGGRTYTTPADGTYRIGVFNERVVTFSGLDGDVNRDGNPAGSSGTFGVLWDPVANTVWVDANQDADFGDEPAMTDYAVGQDTGTFGQDDPATDVRETVPFVVQTDGPRKLVAVTPATGDHGTGVASAAVGKGFFGGAFDGSAPEARLAVVRSTGFTSAILEGAVHLTKRSGADLISLSFGPSSPPAFNPSVTVYSVVFDRLTENYGVQIFASAGNSGPTLESVASPSTTRRVVSVGASVSPTTTQALLGAPLDAESVFGFSSRGPADDGALKPDLVAPGLTLVANPAWQEGAGFPSAGYELPPGYATYFGTSFSSPMAAGAAALLVSAARQTAVPAQPEQLRQALYSGPRRLAHDGVEDQGRGVLDVGRAWQVLRQKLAPVVIDTQAPVRTRNSQRLIPAHTGVGLYEREGWAAGQTGSRSITLTRQTGKGTPVRYNLSWTGNDGTFTAPGTVTLPRRQPAAVPIGISVGGPGAHGAILNVDDPATPGIDHQVPAHVVASQGFSDANEFTTTVSGSFAHDFDVVRSFPTLPIAEVLAMRIRVVDAAEPVFVVSANPFGQQRFPGIQLAEGDRFDVPWPLTADGSWELAMQGTSDFTLEVSIIGGVQVEPTEVVIDPATVGAPHPFELAFSTSDIGFTGRAVGSDLGPLRTDRPTLEPGVPAVYEMDVPAGASAVAARVDHATDPGADIDLYLFDCTGTVIPECILAAEGTSPIATEQVVAQEPPAGSWIVVVDPFLVPAGTVQLDYVDVATSPAFGSITVDDAATFHPSHTSWTRTATATPLVPSPDGPLGGVISVASGDSLLWGGARVELRNVAAG